MVDRAGSAQELAGGQGVPHPDRPSGPSITGAAASSQSPTKGRQTTGLQLDRAG